MILQGRKTETRRFWDVPKVAAGMIEEAVTIKGQCPVCHGEQVLLDECCYECKGVGELEAEKIADIEILDVRAQKVCDFTDEDAKAEGMSTHDELWRGLMDIYGELPLQRECFAVRFRLVE